MRTWSCILWAVLASMAPGRHALAAEAPPGPAMAPDVEEIVFAARPFGPDPHYYANFGYYCFDPSQKVYPSGGRLCKLDTRTGQVEVLLDDPTGGVRDPEVHYDAGKILFSYRRGGTDYYHLWEMDADGTGLRQLTDGEFDDIEPAYLPDGDIVFCSSRCNRWVACWKVPVAILYRCDGDGGNVRMFSSNAVTENTPAVLPDGRLLYTRWEYNDRSQLCYHHLWTVNLDGTGQMAYFGNMHPMGMAYNLAGRSGNVVTYNNVPGAEAMLDARPIPRTGSIVAIFSPGHGRPEHQGFVTLVDPRLGPDHQASARRIHDGGAWRDPYPLAADCFLVARGRELHLMDDRGNTRVLHALADARPEMMLHEPVPLRPRRRERVVADRRDPSRATARLILSDVTRGRNMQGVVPGEVKKLLVLEQLPAPMHNSPGFDGISLWGSFTIARILGTVPVEADGSAYLEVPAMRSLFFVALDENDLSVKKMQSFVTLQPGEVTSCVGCHEPRTVTPQNPGQATLLAVRRRPSQPTPIADVPQIVDFRRHVQPILDEHCLKCHGPDDPDGGICLDGGRGVPSHGRGRVLLSYVALVQRLGEVADGRNAHGNHPPRTIGSGGSKLISRIDGSHYDVHVSPRQAAIVRLWLDSGAVANGTYAIMDGGTPESPSPYYIREMKRYGVLPDDLDATSEPIDVYATDEAYWRLFWYRPGGP
ncbi:MAG: PD40 domain-containing protein [Pirellulales bacterium]|nr:PD40 domain-containing protein [Pirellulales bacterium]